MKGITKEFLIGLQKACLKHAIKPNDSGEYIWVMYNKPLSRKQKKLAKSYGFKFGSNNFSPAITRDEQLSLGFRYENSKTNS